jgi:hypothetical protein
LKKIIFRLIYIKKNPISRFLAEKYLNKLVYSIIALMQGVLMSFRFSKKASSIDLLEVHARELCKFLERGGYKPNDSAIALSSRFKKGD